MIFISMFPFLKMTPAEDESTLKKYGAFLNSFHPDVKRLIWRIERINYKIGKNMFD